MIRLYLKNYRSAELVQLYNALAFARSSIVSDAISNPTNDLDEILSYLSGYIDAKENNEK